MYDVKRTIEIKSKKVKDIIADLSTLNPEAEFLVCGDNYAYINIDNVSAEDLNGYFTGIGEFNSDNCFDEAEEKEHVKEQERYEKFIGELGK